jgi:serine phosphatase RsbU (regulator of sigma subunit)
MSSYTYQNVDFVTREQRIRFISRVIPFVDLAFALLITLTAQNKMAVFILAALNPVLTVLMFNSGFRSRYEQQFNLAAVVTNTIAIFFLFTLAGPAAPVYLMGVTFIGASCMIFVDAYMVMPVIGGMLFATAGAMWVTNRSALDILIVESILICFTMLMTKIVQFTMFHGQVVVEANSQIIAQKHQIEERNKDITDSLNYALRIQRAELPSRSDIFRALPDAMVLYRPKDIVSGDFYFFKEKDDFIYLAAADCTGHGVPGAFMSLIGMERLSDAVAKSDNPGEILNLLNQSLAASLHSNTNKAHTYDGLDIALCVIDKSRKLIHYAGANRPLWIRRQQVSGIEEIKPTKVCINGQPLEQGAFASHTIPYSEGDAFYMFSDGYADTFSGDTNKKLTSRKFKELLNNLSDKSMYQQQHYLDQFLENWRSGEEQTDDILVVGFKMKV